MEVLVISENGDALNSLSKRYQDIRWGVPVGDVASCLPETDIHLFVVGLHDKAKSPVFELGSACSMVWLQCEHSEVAGYCRKNNIPVFMSADQVYAECNRRLRRHEDMSVSTLEDGDVAVVPSHHRLKGQVALVLLFLAIVLVAVFSLLV